MKRPNFKQRLLQDIFMKSNLCELETVMLLLKHLSIQLSLHTETKIKIFLLNIEIMHFISVQVTNDPEISCNFSFLSSCDAFS